ncbi:MAG: 3-deoxy-7-phosphoheptulonate synthase [Acidobacteriia bacterium]|nr:3-deoxy-7-phosphoheptulonate synthase [Terriglobia bacterium]
MIIILEPDLEDQRTVIAAVRTVAGRYPGVTVKPYEFKGTTHRFGEVHLIGPTAAVPTAPFEGLPGVRQVVRVSAKYRLIGRHDPAHETVGFEHNGVRIDDRTVHVFAGLCAVDTPAHVDEMMAGLAREGVVTTRMGAYKPRSSPYDFQGLGKECLPWVFESAGKHGIRLIAMEATDASHLDELWDALERAGHPTAVMVQIGTRNAQNYELLKKVGRQQEFPVLFKRGMGITLEESLNACEYIASEGNTRILFCLRGVKSHLGEPHRNLVDFAHVPVVRRQTRLPVCIDPSHSVGTSLAAPDGLPDIFHAAAQGIVAGATAVLVDFHPHPEKALCDGGQALRLEMLGPLLDHIRRVRAAYEGSVKASAARRQAVA